MLMLLLMTLVGLAPPTPMDQAMLNASTLTLAGDHGSRIMEDHVIAWASEAIEDGDQPPADWETRLRLIADRNMVHQVGMRIAEASPGSTVTDEMARGRIGPELEQQSGISGNRCWMALSAPLKPRDMKVKIKSQIDPASTEISLAVLPFKELGPDPETGIGHALMLVMISSINASNVTLVEREEVRKIIEAREFSKLDATEDSASLFVGRLLNARYLLIGTVGQAGPDDWILTGRIIDSVTGEIVDGHRAAITTSLEGRVQATRDLAVEMGLRFPPGKDPEPIALHDQASPGTVESIVRAVPRQGPVDLELVPSPSQAVYTDQQEIAFKVRSDRDGYLTMFVVSPTGDVTLLVPNPVDRSGRVTKGESLTIPTPGRGISFTVKPPHGLTRVKAFVTPEPLIVPGSFNDQRVQLLKLARETHIGSAGVDPLDNPDWTCREFSFMTRPGPPKTK